MGLFGRKNGFDWNGRVCVVTGGSRGLGLLLARRLCEAGASVSICARDPVELARAERELSDRIEARGSRGAVMAYQCDVSSHDDAAAFVRATVDRFGRIDALINNAGIISVGPVETMTDADFDESIRTHFWGAYNLIVEALPHMPQGASSRIANISSIGGMVPAPHLLPYTVGKFALVGFSEGLRSELAARGIAVTTVAPGLLRTGSALHAHVKGDKRREFGWFLAADSMPVISMDADRAAEAILAGVAAGRARLVLTLPAKLAVLGRALAPEFTARALAFAAGRMPAGDPRDTSWVPGSRVETSPSAEKWKRVTMEAARRNNEMPTADLH